MQRIQVDVFVDDFTAFSSNPDRPSIISLGPSERRVVLFFNTPERMRELAALLNFAANNLVSGGDK